MHHPGKLNRESLEMIRCVLGLYPFFTTVRLLLIRNLFQLGEGEYRSEIEVAAAYVTDRRILYELLHPLSDNNNETPEDPSGKENEIKETGGETITTTEKEDPGTMPPEETVSGTGMAEKTENPVPVEITAGKVSAGVPEEKPGLQQNISNLLSLQLKELELADPDEAELVPEIGLDIQKTYGNKEENSETSQDVGSRELFTLDLDAEQPVQDPVPVITDKEGSPVNVSGDLYSFSDWLSAIDRPKGSKDTDVSKKDPAQNEKVLIDKFIETNPRLEPRKDNVPHKDISEDSVKEYDGIFTDTLARIYIKQGYYSKAIFAYEKLILKFPEKSGYFANQIKEIKKLTNKQ